MENKEGTKKERRVTTPEEAAVMTRQRRREFGLGEEKELTLEETKKIEADIEALLKRLDDYTLKSFSPEMQKEWYLAEQEAGAGKDRELARANLEKFFNTLQKQVGAEGK